MKKAALFSLTFLAATLSAGEQAPQFTKDNELIRPTDYREWIYVTSGLGMAYGSSSMEMGEPPFDNVFVQPAAYRAFLESGKWPDKTIFVLEVRSSKEHGSINKSGHFQGDLMAVEAAVKTSRVSATSGLISVSAAASRCRIKRKRSPPTPATAATAKMAPWTTPSFSSIPRFCR